MRCGRSQVLAASVVLVAAATLIGLGSGLAAIAKSTAEAQDVRMVVVDTDGGPDDALAILLLLAAENESMVTRTRVQAVTCVRGNAEVHNATRNVLATLKSSDRLDVPVFAGAEVPLLPPAANFGPYYGLDGFGDFLPSQPEGAVKAEHAAVALVRLAKEHPGRSRGEMGMRIKMAGMRGGTRDNLSAGAGCAARAARATSAINIDTINMPSALSVAGNGNARPGAEFNIFMDPDAALVVFEATDKPFSLMPWETALEAEIPMEWRLKVMGSLNTPEVQMLNQAENKTLDASTWVSADGLLAATLIDAQVVASRVESHVTVLTGEGAARGVTLVDHSNTLQRAPNAVVLEKPNVSLFQRLILRLMNR